MALPHGGEVGELVEVGRGAAGVVLRGVLGGRAVGVKLDRDVSRLVREALVRTLGSASVPLDGGLHDGMPFLVFAWTPGVPLPYATPVPAASGVARDVGASLARLHLLGFRHGDVKAENVVVDATRAALVDFGLAAPFEEPLVGGNLAALPPEIFADAEGALRVGAEADVFALGRLLEALAARAKTPLSPELRQASATRPGERPSAAMLAGWRGGAPVDAAYVAARRDELERGAVAGRAPPEGPARRWVSGLMRAIAGLHGTRADGAPLDALSGDARRKFLALVLGSRADAFALPQLALPQAELALLDRLTHGARAFDVPHTVDELRTQLARLAMSPGDPDALATVAAMVPSLTAATVALDETTALAAVTILRRAGAIDAARTLVEARLPGTLAHAEILRLGGDTAGALRVLAALRTPEAGALRGRIAIDRGDVEGACAAVGDDAASVEVRALIAWTRGAHEEGLRVLDETDTTDAERTARAMVVRGMLHHARGDAVAAHGAFVRAGDLALAIGALPLEANARASAAAAAHDAGRLGDALDAAGAAITSMLRLDRARDAARARLNRAATLLALGATTEADADARLAHDGAEGDPRAQAYALFARVEASLSSNGASGGAGATERSLVADAARLLAEGPATDAVLVAAYRALVQADAEGEPVATPKGLDEAEPVARFTWYRAALARTELALDTLAEVVRASDVEAPPSVVGPVLAQAIEVARREGRGDAARALTDRLHRAVSRLEEGVPLSHRASFAGQPWVAAAREAGASSRGEDLAVSPAQIDVLAGIARGLRDRTSLSDLLRQVVDGLVLWLGVERGLLLLRAPDGARLVPRVARGLSRDDLRGEQLALSRTLANRALETLEPVVAFDAAGAREGDSLSASIHALRLRSVLAVPLVARGEALGVVYLDDRIRRGAFGPREIAWVRLLATQAASAIADARDALRLRRYARRAERAEARMEELLAKTEGTLDVVRAELAEVKPTVRGTRHAYPAILGDGAAIRKTLALVDRVADASDSRIPILVVGESGTGKELVARAIHDARASATAAGRRRSGPFVAENCGAIPESLLESTLFGHVRGAFTGADRSRVGLFEVAHGGTLFLDEIGEMGAAMQAKLLRVLQDGEVRPVGGERTTKVDVRVVGATHRDLEAMVKDGSFREDLYYRLAVVTITVPPLRDRTEDLPGLIEHFVRRWSDTRKIRVTKNALAVLATAPWPGNVRQLENELRRALVLCDEVLDVEHLSPEILTPRGAGRGGEGPLTLRDQLDALERRLVHDALRRASGNQTHAARALGVSRFGLQKMIKRLGLAAATGPASVTSVAKERRRG